MEQRAKEAKEVATMTATTTANVEDKSVLEMDEADFINQEHLQLTLEEAFFLSYALGSFHITFPTTSSPSNSWDLLDVFRQHSTFPPLPSSAALVPDDHFLLSYITYHHFRSLGWVVRPGLKFAVDFLLYERGPVFTHATFAVLIVPSYSDPYWFATEERRRQVEKERKRRSWEWFHCANRVQNQVLKTLVLCYVDVPSPMEEGGEGDVGRLLGRYRVREFCVKRWSANRNRE
jgi:tRNA-splicing endonuclease subunit Sen2